MARNLKPRHKSSRRFGENVADTLKNPLVKRNNPPGMHGAKRSFAKVSEYGRQLLEKQKTKMIYGLLEKQFALTFERAGKIVGDVGDNFLTLLETRLDNAVYRAGWAQTRRMARQLVTHGHFTVDGVKVDIPSYTIRPGEVIKVKENKKDNTYWKNLEEMMKKVEREVPGWLAVNTKDMSATVTSLPNKSDLPRNIEIHLIVDFYSR
ncbi:MAG: 30S ribosomal protein S4 [Parcubacteria group bacterium]|nr:MAG: 30S ribosomal protein S4 [Parcubacteria group bacterium]